MFCADLIVLLLDLVEALITVVYFNEDEFGAWYLFGFWVAWGFVTSIIQEVVTESKVECIVWCFLETVQCALYNYFCAFKLLSVAALLGCWALQIIVKVAGAFADGKQDENGNKDCGLASRMKANFVAAYFGVLPLLFTIDQTDSMFATKYYEALCAFLFWWTELYNILLTQGVIHDTGDITILKRAIHLIPVGIYFVCLIAMGAFLLDFDRPENGEKQKNFDVAAFFFDLFFCVLYLCVFGGACACCRSKSRGSEDSQV